MATFNNGESLASVRTKINDAIDKIDGNATISNNISVGGNITVTGTVDGRDLAADGTKLDAIEASATADQTGAEIKALYEAEADTNAFTDAEQTKLSGIEASADVTDTANVTAAGALMDSELADIAAVKALNQGVATTDDPTFTNTQLAAISETISDTAVDIFVYDTSKDSDGGAWRKRTQHTSWYNETLNTATRGSRKEFPAVAVIVAESNQVTIYDGDDPDLPMWMVFNAGGGYPSTYALGEAGWGGPNAVVMLNGTLCTPRGLGGLPHMSFIDDACYRISTDGLHSLAGGVAVRNSGMADTISNSSKTIVYGTINDVAMTVLPNAPIDAATGLPVPTIAVATDGGISVIKDDGTVVDITNSNSSFSVTDEVTLDSSGRLSFVNSYSLGGNAWVYVFNNIPTSDNVITINTKTGSTQDADAMYDPRGSASVSEDLVLVGPQDDIDASTGTVFGNASGISSVAENTTSPSEGMVAYTTSDYATGWMNGDIKLATLSDTDDTDVTGSELVTNGTFDSDLTGWTDHTSIYMTVSHNSGAARLTYASSFSGWYGIGQTISTVVGKTYVASYDVTESDSANMQGSHFYLGDSTVLYGQSGTFEKSGTITATFVATSTTTDIRTGHGGNGVGSGDFYTVDNFTVRLAEEDRSVNGNGLQVFGTVTKNPVATGADLVAYSGFSASNYLEQPYNSDLDFGTGDFCYMGWFKTSSNGITMFERCASPRSGNGMTVYMDGTGKPIWYKIVSGTPTIVVTPTAAYNNNSWVHFAAIRQNGVVSLYFNGQKDGSASDSTDMTNTSAIFRLGANAIGTSGWTGSLALWRISATAPSPEQIARIYNDEKHLFTEGAQATLYGSSDSVTALAFDDTTNILSVGTSAGRSDFQGLRRVNNTTTGVTTSISASNGLIVEQ